MNKIEKYVNAYSKNREIYHYTNIEALIGIIQNRGFWLSNVKYLNDSEELINGIKLSIKIVDKLLTKKMYKPFYEVLVGVKEELNNLELIKYIASFSLNGDSLEKWRAYANSKDGVSIGFDFNKKLSYPLFQSKAFRLSSVIYDDRIKSYILLKQIANSFDLYIKDKNRDKEYYIKTLTKNLGSHFVNFKNHHFLEEQEVRIETDNLAFFKQKQYRVKNSEIIIPYVCTYDTIIEPSKRDELLPITKVVVGPVSNQKITMESIKEFLQDYGYNPDIVVKSDIPYRG